MAIQDNKVLPKFPLLDRRFVIAAGGVLAAGIGGYLLYRRYASGRPASSDIPVDPKQAEDDTSKSHSQSDQNRASSSADSGRLPLRDSTNKIATDDDVIDDTKRIKEEGNQMFKDKNYEKAIERYTKAIEICPSSQHFDLATLYQNRAATYEKLSNFDMVIEDCTKALEANKTYVKALLRRANAFEVQQNFREAAHDFLKCCILENFGREETARRASKAVKALSHTLAVEYMNQRRADGKPVPWSKTVAKATLRAFGSDSLFSRLQRPDFDDLVSNGHHHVTGDDDNAGHSKSTVEEVRDAMRQQQYEKVVQLCTHRIESSPEPAQVIQLYESLLIRSLLHNLCGSVDLAKKDAVQVLDSLSGENPNVSKEQAPKLMCSAYLMLAFSEHLSSNFHEAQKHLNMAEQVYPENADIFSLRGQIMSLHGETSEMSCQEFEKAIKLKPDFIHYQIQLLACQTKLAGEQGNAAMISSIVDKVRSLVVQHPKDVDANMFFAQLLLEMEQVPDAARHLNVAAELDPQSADIFAQKAIIEMYSSRPDNGMALLNKALELDPYCLMALEILAQHYSKQSDLPKMTECFNKALEVSRSETEVAHFICLRETALFNMQIAEEMLIR